MSEKCPECEEGVPAWVMTFADLMTLLMCFFVLLLSFAQMDVSKFKAVSGSMKDAFGDDLLAKIPGTLKFMLEEEEVQTDIPTPGEDEQEEQARPKKAGIKKDMEELQDKLQEEIRAGVITVEDGGGKITVRVEQLQAFPSGNATLLTDFVGILDKVSEVLVDSDAHVHVDGHTDNVPISTQRYRSNWELSAARAASVAVHLLKTEPLDPARVQIRGNADSQPLFPNDSPDHRAANRRIEIVFEYENNPEDGAAGDEDADPAEKEAAGQTQGQQADVAADES